MKTIKAKDLTEKEREEFEEYFYLISGLEKEGPCICNMPWNEQPNTYLEGFDAKDMALNFYDKIIETLDVGLNRILKDFEMRSSEDNTNV